MKGERRDVKIKRKSLIGAMSAFAPCARASHPTSARNTALTAAAAAAAHSAAVASARGVLGGSTTGEGGDRPLPSSPAVAAGVVMSAVGGFRAVAAEGEGDHGVLSGRAAKTTTLRRKKLDD